MSVNVSTVVVEVTPQSDEVVSITTSTTTVNVVASDEVDPIFSSSEASKFEDGDKAKLDGLSNPPDMTEYFNKTTDDLDDVSEGTTKKTVTQAEKDSWNSKQSALGFTPENVSNKKTTLADNSDSFYPTQKAVKTAVDAKQNSLGFTPENSANKNQANGYPGLDSDGKISSSQLPAIAVSDVFTVASEIAMLALTAQIGDVAIRTDENKTYILSDTDATVLANWKLLLFPSGAVSSVFSRSGAITAQSGDYNTSQITESADKKFVTDAEKTKLSNLSGTNTGDQIIPDQLSDLSEDATHRTVTDTEKSTWNAKQNALVADTDYLTPGTASSTYEPKKGATDNYLTDTEQTKLAGIEAGAEVNNISDVNATDLTDGGATTLHKHSYNNLDDKPIIPDELADLSQDATHRVVTDTEKSTWNGKQDALGFTPENSANKENSTIDTSTTKYPTVNLLKTGLDAKQSTSEKNQANGYAGLDAGGKISSSQLPGIAITTTSVVASEVAMLALTAETGDVAVRSDLNKTFILSGTDPSNIAHWTELLTPTDTVTSVNSKTGAVTLDTDDLSDTGKTHKFTTASDISKLAGIEANADVTDAGNVGSAIHGATAKTTPVDADTIPTVDSEASNVLKKVTWTNIKAFLKTYFDSIYQATLGYTAENSANKENTTIDTSTTKYPTINLLKTGLDGKVNANAGITGATKTKITYDAKGLVTGGADATTADIADSTNKRYVTDAQQTVLGNTSGTNTGDQTDLPIVASPGSDVTASGVKITLTAGESLVFGDICYIKSDGKLWKADANGSSTYPALFLAIASISADASGSFLALGIARQDSWNWTVGGMVYLSTTAGGLTQSQPSATDEVIQVVGVATHADRIYFNPVITYITHA